MRPGDLFRLSDVNGPNNIGRLPVSGRAGGGEVGEGARKEFRFDHVYSQQSSQDVINGSVGVKVLQNAWEGKNACVFAYGQTGSGKTNTMTGEKGGLVRYIVGGLWEGIEKVAERSLDAGVVETCEGKIECRYAHFPRSFFIAFAPLASGPLFLLSLIVKMQLIPAPSLCHAKLRGNLQRNNS